MSQTSYLKEQPVAFAGLLGDLVGPQCVESKANGEASAELAIGYAAAFGATADKCLQVNEATDKICGIVLHSHAYAVGVDTNDAGDALKPKAMCGLLRQGTVYIKSETAAVAGDRGYTRYAAGAGGTILGGIRNAAVGGETIDTTKNIQYLDDCAAGGFARVLVDFLNA